MLQFILDHKDVLLGALLAVSEALALSPAIKANSIFQAIVNGIKSLAGK